MPVPLYLVWSNEHKAWWRPGEGGYTRRLSEAGHYSRADALRICTHAVPGTAQRFYALPEIPVRLSDVLEVQRRYHTQYAVSTVEGWE